MDTLTEDQQAALDQFKLFMSMEGGGFFLLQGPAGSGKSYLTSSMLDYLKSSTWKRVGLAASTHKAAKVLSDFTEKDVITSHAMMGMREQINSNGELIFVPGLAHKVPADDYHIIIIDEASMVADEIFLELEEQAVLGKKIVFIGDQYQIPPISMPNSLPFEVDVQRELSFTIATLSKIVRQAEGNPIITLATLIRESIYRPVSPFSYSNDTKGLLGVKYTEKHALGGVIDGILDMFASEEFKADPDYVKILAWTNKTVDSFNRQVREKLFGENIPKIMVGDKLVANAPAKEGREILVKNNEDMEVLGVAIEDDQLDQDTVLKVYKARVKIFGMRGESREAIIPIIHEEDEGLLKKFLSMFAALAKKEKRGSYKSKSLWMDFYKLKERYADVKYAYAITTHKAQGSTYDHAVVMLWDMENNRKTEERNRILYTAVTRPRYTLQIIH